MARWDKFRQKLMSGQADANIEFRDLTGYLKHLGFVERIAGDHFIYSRAGISGFIDVQPENDGKAKPYQV